MRAARSLPPLLLGLLTVACGGRGPATLVVAGAGLTSVEGKTVKVALVDTARHQIAQSPIQTTVSGGAFQVSLSVSSDTAYRVDLYADADNDGHCQWGFDQVYAVDVSGVSERATKTVTIDPTVATDSRGCLSFGASSLHVTASNVQTSKTIWAAALVRCVQGDGNCAVGTGQTAGVKSGTLANGAIDLLFDGGIVPGYFYRVNIFVNDLVGLEVSCNSAPVKMSRVSVQLPGSETDGLNGGPVDLEIDPTGFPADTTICPSFAQH